MKKQKDIFVHAIYGSTYKDLQKEIKELKKRKYDLCFINHLKQDKEKLESILDELEKINEDQLTEIFMLHFKINKAIEYLNKWNKKHKEQHDYTSIHADELLKILGDKET